MKFKQLLMQLRSFFRQILGTAERATSGDGLAGRRTGSGDTMVKLIIAIKRREGLSQEQFRMHLSRNHAELVRNCPATAKYVRKYVQSYALLDGTNGAAPTYDGASELWFETAEDMNLFFADPAYLADVRVDESRFADLERTAFFITQEKQIV